MSTEFGIGIIGIIQGSSSVVLEYNNYGDRQTTLKVRERSSKLLNSSDCRVFDCAQTVERIKLLLYKIDDVRPMLCCIIYKEFLGLQKYHNATERTAPGVNTSFGFVLRSSIDE